MSTRLAAEAEHSPPARPDTGQRTWRWSLRRAGDVDPLLMPADRPPPTFPTPQPAPRSSSSRLVVVAGCISAAILVLIFAIQAYWVTTGSAINCARSNA